ncbi:hypothetical protein [Ascidiaceihabitans sp.]|uniref:hypothetical protein n=1 Tax=Ascidiaceihabitans sp. TaxID=1872644 RepID=UPI003297E0C5
MKSLLELPDIESFKRRLQSLASLDAIVCPEWEFRYFSYDANWAQGEEMGSIRNGSGDEVFALFSIHGCFIKEYCRAKSIKSNAYESVAVEFLEATKETAFSPNRVTNCYWKTKASDRWSMSESSETSDSNLDELLSLVDGNAETYLIFAKDYFEKTLPLGAVSQVLKFANLTTPILDSLEFDGQFHDLSKELEQIGYPTAFD